VVAAASASVVLATIVTKAGGLATGGKTAAIAAVSVMAEEPNVFLGWP